MTFIVDAETRRLRSKNAVRAGFLLWASGFALLSGLMWYAITKNDMPMVAHVFLWHLWFHPMSISIGYFGLRSVWTGEDHGRQLAGTALAISAIVFSIGLATQIERAKLPPGWTIERMDESAADRNKRLKDKYGLE